MRAAAMYACYRSDGAANPEMFLAAAASILADFPEDVILYVTDPRTGLPGKIKWPPQPAEVREACLDRANYLARLDEREERLARQRAEEKKFLDAKPAHPIERVNLILERHGFSPVNSVTEKGKRDRECATAELVALCEREGLDPKILDSIPDAN